MRKERKYIGVGFAVMLLFAVMVAGCGGGGSTDTTATTTSSSTTTSGDEYLIVGPSGGTGRVAGRDAGAVTATSSLLVIPSGTTVPAGYEVVPSATVQFTDSSGNIVSLTTDANGKFNPNDLSDSSKSSDSTKGAEIVKSAQTDPTQQPTITVLPPSTGKFKDAKPAEADVTLAPAASTSSVDIASIKVFPDVKKVLTGKPVILNAIALDTAGKVTRPPLSVTWSITGTGTASGDITSQSSKSFTCVYTPATGSAGQKVTITATTKTSSTGDTITATAILEVIDSSTLYTLSGTIYETTSSTSGWANAVINFNLKPASTGEAPVHIVTKGDSSGNFSISLPPNMTFDYVAIGSPAVAGSTQTPYIQTATPTTYLTGASGGSGTKNFYGLGVKATPPPPPPPIDKYLQMSYMNMREILGKPIIANVQDILRSTATEGINKDASEMRGWTWVRTFESNVYTWTITEPASAAINIVPHRRIVIKSSAAGAYEYVMNIVKDGDIRTATSTLTEQKGTWTQDLTFATNGSPSGSILSTVKFFTPDKQTTPQRTVVSSYTIVNDAFTIAQDTYLGDSKTTLVSSYIITRSAHDDTCTTSTCNWLTYANKQGTYITNRAYTADGSSYKEFKTTLSGGFKGDHSAAFIVTNATTDDPQAGATIAFSIAAPSNSPSQSSNAISGYIKDKDGNVIATFTIDFKNWCKMTKFPGTANATTMEFQL